MALYFPYKLVVLRTSFLISFNSSTFASFCSATSGSSVLAKVLVKSLIRFRRDFLFDASIPANMKGPYAPAYSIGGGGRLSLSLDLVPGPASYNTDSDTKRSAPRPVIGKSQRYGHSTSRTGPGPGQYDTPSRIGQGRKALLFARNLPEMDRSRSPGPADYSPSDLTANCSYSVGRSKRHRTLSQHDVGPGPGSYNPRPISKASPRAT